MLATNSRQDMGLNQIHEGQQGALCIGKMYHWLKTLPPSERWIVAAPDPCPEGRNWQTQIVSRLRDAVRWKLTWVLSAVEMSFCPPHKVLLFS